MRLLWPLALLLVRCLAALAGSSASLTFEVVDQVNWRGDKAAAVPASVTESYAYDAASDTVAVTVKFDKAGFAPVPPMLALAVKYGFPIEFDRKPTETGQASVLGPLLGFEDTAQYTWKVKGLAKYVFGGGDRQPISKQPEIGVSPPRTEG